MQPTLTLEQARLAAHKNALRTDATYRAMWERYDRLRPRDVRRPATDAGADSITRYGIDLATGVRDGSFVFRNVRRLWNLDALPIVRCLMFGPGWRRHFSVARRSIEDVKPPWMDRCRDGRRWLLTITLEEDVRELVTTAGAGCPEPPKPEPRFDEIRPGVFAMWDDPRERLEA